MWTNPHPIYRTSFGIKKDSPYKRFFAKIIDELRENGQLHIYEVRNSIPHLGCSHSRTEGNSLGMLKLASLFLVFVLGPLLSIIILCYECFYQPRMLSSSHKIKVFTRNLENTMSGMIPLLKDSPYEYAEKYFKIQEIIQEMKTEASIAVSNENEDR